MNRSLPDDANASKFRYVDLILFRRDVHSGPPNLNTQLQAAPMLTMLQTATVLLAITALGGLLMAGIRFTTKQNPPAWLAMLHGLLAASGLTLLAYAICTQPVPAMATLALVLFLLAAAGGAVMSLAYKWRQRLLPAWLVVVHAIAAATAFVLLLMAAFGQA